MCKNRINISLLFCINLILFFYSSGSFADSQLDLLKSSLVPSDVAIIVNDSDKLSLKTGDYYRKQRHIPQENLIHVNFKPGQTNMSVVEFNRIKKQIDAATPAGVQAYVVTWLKPYRVTCMSITSAFAFGFNKSFCAQGCKKTKISRYYNSDSHSPYTNYGIRPTMVLAGITFDDVKKLIQRGIEADNTAPMGTAYLMDTNDKNRNVRALSYKNSISYMKDIIKVKRIKGQALENKTDVFFYFTGLAHVPAIETNHFLPGAMADHLTSAGGRLTDSGQMSIMKWIDAGATASYGAVVEPCNMPQKFPHPLVAMVKYLSGDTLIEAYWKSVNMPGQGIFVGEPLARPYGNVQHSNKR